MRTHANDSGGFVLRFGQVLENTPSVAVSRPVSAALSRPNIVQWAGCPCPQGMGRDYGSVFNIPPTPAVLENANGVDLQVPVGTRP